MPRCFGQTVLDKGVLLERDLHALIFAQRSPVWQVVLTRLSVLSRKFMSLVPGRMAHAARSRRWRQRRRQRARDDAAAEDGSTAIGPHCFRCAAVLPPWFRQGFLRHDMRRWPARVIDPNP